MPDLGQCQSLDANNLPSAVLCLYLCRRHSSVYHYNIVPTNLTKWAIPPLHAFFLSQGNLTMSRD